MRNNITIIGLIVLALLALWIFAVPEFTVYLPSKDILPGGELIESAPEEFVPHRKAMQQVLNRHQEPFYVNDRGLLMISSDLAQDRRKLDAYTREAEERRNASDATDTLPETPSDIGATETKDS